MVNLLASLKDFQNPYPLSEIPKDIPQATVTVILEGLTD
jgi:hypothetical protein